MEATNRWEADSYFSTNERCNFSAALVANLQDNSTTTLARQGFPETKEKEGAFLAVGHATLI